MFFEVLLAILLGICAGIITGLIPGIHVNLVSALLLSFSVVLLKITTIIPLAVFIISMATIHTFLDTIPSIYLGAPDSAQVLGVLPGHKMLLEGHGYQAIKLTAIGSFLSMTTVVILSPILILFMTIMQKILAPIIGLLLLIIIALLIIREKKRFHALFLFLVSGVFGLLVLNLNMKQPLFPMLSGLFGLSTLFMSLNDNSSIPKQKPNDKLNIGIKDVFRCSGAASLVGSLVGFFPGVGSAQAAVVGSQFIKDQKEHFLMLVGGISTANMVASMITFFTLDKARNGAIVVIKELLEQITFNEFMLFVFVALVSGSCGVILTMVLAKQFSKLIQKVSYRYLCTGVISTIIFLVLIMSGWIGLLVLAIATFIGMIAPLVNISRSHAMGCLMVPVLLYFIL